MHRFSAAKSLKITLTFRVWEKFNRLDLMLNFYRVNPFVTWELDPTLSQDEDYYLPPKFKGLPAWVEVIGFRDT